MKSILVIVLALSTLNSFAQKAFKNAASSFAKTITPEDLKKQLLIVASKEMEGRETATEGERKAAAYIESQFKRIGLEPGNNGSYQMYYNVYQDSLIDAEMEVNGQRFELDRDFNPVIATNSNGAFRVSELVFIGPAAALDSLKNMNLAGKFVLLVGGSNPGRNQGPNIYSTVISKGVAGILSVQSNYPRSAASNRKGNQTVNLFRRSISPQQFTVSENIARAIMGSSFDEDKKNTSLIKTVSANLFTEVDKSTITVQTSNVIGILPGTDLKDEYLFVTAHHDHIGKRGDSIINYGADDDGSGTVSVIEIAEAFAKAKAAGKGPSRTMVFMTVSGEEKGLWGSDHYGNNPIYPLDKTTADLNIDMIGRIDPTRKHGDSTNYVYVVGDDKLSSDLRPISESVNKKYSKLELDYKFNDPKDPMRIYYRSDHYNFAKHGVPIIFYFNGTHADYHRPGDTIDKINFSLLAKRAQFVFYTAWEMANRDEMLKRDIPLDSNVFTR
jgi:hypothetical protein